MSILDGKQASSVFAQLMGVESEINRRQDLMQQRQYVAGLLRQLLDKGFSPEVLIEMFIAGAAFLGDNIGVSRAQMADAIKDLQLSPDRQLIYTPTPIGG